MAELNGVKLEKIPIKFQLGDAVIDGAVIRPLTFQAFVDTIAEARGMTEPKAFDARMRRVRMAKQVSYYVNGTVMPVSMTDILQMPIQDTHKIAAQLDHDEGKQGKIVRDGNGIDQAIVYELGTPIPVGKDKEPIRELEFHAKTYGDIEDVMAADDSMSQAAKLIETVAKPLGTTLTALPSWAVTQIAVTDGIAIARDILPRFLGSPTE
jgi:hypothetical protein